MIPALAMLIACYCIPRLLTEPLKFDKRVGEVFVWAVCLLGCVGVIGSCAMVVLSGSSTPTP